MGDIRDAGLCRLAEAPSFESRLREAVEAEQLVLYYQPKFDLASGSICGLEALLRWEDPLHGLVAPDELIPALEHSDLMLEVGSWAIRHALSQRLAWHISGLRPPSIAVNVSPVQLRHPDFVSTTCESLETVGVGTPGLEVELAESVIREEGNGHCGKLRALGDRGVRIAIDDCGTDAAHFEQLSHLPVCELKIDRPHIARITADPAQAAALRATVELAHARKLTVLAEGVETVAQRQLLRALKCDRMQGYLASRPLPAPEVALLLRRQVPNQVSH